MLPRCRTAGEPFVIPTFDVQVSDVEGFMDELQEFQSVFHDCFARSEARGHFLDYMVGQYSPLARKSIEPMALAVEGGRIRSLPLSLSRLNHRLPRSQAYPEVVQGTAEFHHQVTDTLLPQADAVFDDATAFHAAVDMLDPQPSLVERLVGELLLQGQLCTAGLLGRHEDRHLREGEGQEAQILQQPTPGWERVGGGLCNAQIMSAAAVRVAQKEDREEGIDQQDIFHRLISFLAAITRFLCSRVLGADDPSLRPVMGKRGESSAATGPTTSGAAVSSSGATPVAASASETPRRWARAARERAGASPRVRRAVSSTGRRTWIHWLALLWPMPNRRPCTTWRLYVFTYARINKSRSSGVGRGQVWYTLKRRAVRGFPSRRHAAICAWKAASKGGISW